ncbi:putative phage tail assembly chaperone [Enterobacteriaceae bacterium ESL0689]|nr:putative phage tail assembly chaperone [Enterobacteriaceae bacterium ESL0689]
MNKDDVIYEHRQANFIEAKNQAMKLLALLKGCISMQDSKVEIDIGGIVSNIGSAEMQGVEAFIIKYVTVRDENDQPVTLNRTDVFNRHFNAHRSHYIPLIIEGIMFHFADFLPDGVASAISMPDSVTLTAR